MEGEHGAATEISLCPNPDLIGYLHERKTGNQLRTQPLGSIVSDHECALKGDSARTETATIPSTGTPLPDVILVMRNAYFGVNGRPLNLGVSMRSKSEFHD